MRDPGTGTLAFHEAVLAGSLKYTDQLLEKGVRPDVLVESCPSLLLALDEGHGEIAKASLFNGASARVDLEAETTPLHKAASAGFLEVYEMLLDLGADINALDKGNCTPLLCATWASCEHIVRFLLVSFLVYFRPPISFRFKLLNAHFSF